MKILKFSLTNRVFGESSESDAAKNVERMINADMVLFGVAFSGTFKESNRQVSVLLSMDTTMSSSKFSLSSIPNLKAITKVSFSSFWLHLEGGKRTELGGGKCCSVLILKQNGSECAFASMVVIVVSGKFGYSQSGGVFLIFAR